VLEYLYAFLEYERLLRMRLVCTEWKTIAEHPRLWYQLYRARFGFMEKKHTIYDNTSFDPDVQLQRPDEKPRSAETNSDALVE
jgi:F-box-like